MSMMLHRAKYGGLLALVLVGLWYVIANHVTVTKIEPKVLRSVHVYTVVGEDMREEVKCEFDEPLKYLTFIMHWYDSNEEMFMDFIALAGDETIDENEEIWGWSDCIWQPDDNWAACDVYVVKPDFVHADMNVDTLGHEALHGACGDFHGD